MKPSRPFPIFLVALTFLLITAGVFSQQAPATETLTSTTEENYEKTTDDAALNLHRWGAVTLFHGLPSERVNAINEDLDGALWFGTDNGLVRYDGRRTQAFGNSGDKNGVLPSQRIRALFRDSAGGLWIGTEQGAARWTLDKLQILEATRGQAVTGFAENPNHEMALVTEQGQIILYQNRNADIKRDGEKFATDLQAQIINGQKHNLLTIDDKPVAIKAIVYNPFTTEWWLGSHRRGGLIVGQDRIREAVPPPTRPYFVNTLFAEGHNIWFGAQTSANESGLWLHNDDQSLGRMPIITGTINAIHGDVSHSTSSAPLDLWIGTEGQGGILLRNGNVMERLTFENTKGGLRSNRILSVYRDREGIVWFGTDRGVCRYDRDSFRTTTLSNDAQSNFIRSLLKTRDGAILAGTNRGLFRLNAGQELGGWEQNLELEKLAVYSLLEANDGKIYVGTAGGLFVAQAGSNHFQAIESPEQGRIRAVTELAGTIYAIVFAGDDSQYLGKGIAKLVGEKLQLAYTDENALQATCLSASEAEKQLRVGTKDGRSLLVKPNGLQAEEGVATGLLHAIIAHEGKLWLGSEAGLVVKEKNALHPVLPGVEIRALSLVTEGEDKHQVLYCATKKAGLYKIRLDGGAISHFDTEQGLPSQQVFATTQGPNGEIWIGTNSGIVRHQPNFSRPQLEPIRMVADNIYTRDYLTKEMRFPAYQKNFSFEFTGLGSKTFPSQFQYEFTCTEDQRGPIREKTITADSQYLLEKMEPGGYTITARAISRDLIYSEPFTFRLWISPEAVSWTTILLTGLLVVAVGAGGYAFYQQRRTSKANQKLEITNTELRDTRIRLAHITEAERSRIARDLHDQTLADLRQLLVMTDQLDQKAPDPQSPALMRRKIEEVSNEIRHICEDLSPSVLENIGFVPALEWALTDAVTHLPAAEKFAYEFHCEPELEERLQLSPTEQIQLYRIVQEAINNVCRHARATKVTLQVIINDQHEIVIAVIDDGIGLPSSPENPTGHGMANIRSRANLIGAEVSWLATRQGSHFVVRKANGEE